MWEGASCLADPQQPPYPTCKRLFDQFGIFSAEKLGLYTKGEYRMPEIRRILKELEDESVLVKGYLLEGSDKLHWHDSQPHPHDATLASSHPHHKHVPPDIKRHRVPAPELTFDAPEQRGVRLAVALHFHLTKTDTAP